MSAIVADLLIWRGWLNALGSSPGSSVDKAGGGTAGTGVAGDALIEAGHSAQVIGLGVCAVVACLTTIALVVCAVSRIRTLHAGVEVLESSGHIAVPALMVRTASAAIVALALAAMGALALGMTA